MKKIQCIFKDIKLSRMFLDLSLLSLKISLAMIVATFRIIVPRPMKRLLGETVLITGAGHGIGRELAFQLSSMGCIIVCWDNDVDANRSTMREVSKNGGEVYGFVVDVSKRVEVRETVKLMRKVGVPDVTILINNAAVLYHKPYLSYNPDDVENTFNVNVFSNFWTIEAFLPMMLHRGSGHIVAMSSMCGIYGVSQKVAYCSSKFAVRGLMEALYEEVRLDERKPNIYFTTIYPFYVDTGLAKDPKYRFPYIFGVVTPEYAAQEVIKAIRRNYIEYSIPRCLFSLNAINRIMPESVMRLILDFLADVDRKQREKDIMNKQTGVVYRINCKDCDAVYIGQTKRHLDTRICVHRRNIKEYHGSHSVVTDHRILFGHDFKWTKPDILQQESHLRKHEIAEMIFIKKHDSCFL